MITAMGPRQSAHWYPCRNPPKATEMVLAVGLLVPNLSQCQTSVHGTPQAKIQKFLQELGHRFVQDCAVKKQGRRLNDDFAQMLKTKGGTVVSWRKWTMAQLGCAGHRPL